tara:strand:- start:384441 stop:386054 length:1614 start_codon:yes stop_codon:yes gene_type:complete
MILIVFVWAGSLAKAQSLKVVDPAPQKALINDVDESKAKWHPVMPGLDRSDFVLVEIDVAKLEPMATLRWLQKITGPFSMSANSDEDARARAANAQQVLSSEPFELEEDSHVYLSVSWESISRREWFSVVPMFSPLHRKGTRLFGTVINNLFAPDPPLQINPSVEERREVFSRARKLLNPGSSEGRSDLVDPLHRPWDYSHTAVLSLPESAKAELIAFWPDRLPRSFPVDFSPKQVMDDVDRIVVGFDLPTASPNETVEHGDSSEKTQDGRLHVRIEASDIQACQRLREVIDKLFAAADVSRPLGRVTSNGSLLIVDIDPIALVKLVEKWGDPSRADANRTAATDAAKKIGIVLHNYHAGQSHMVPRCFTALDGTPLLSWRVALLPYLQQSELYDNIELGDFYDSEANASAAMKIVPVYSVAAPSSPNAPKTRFRAPVFPGSIWHGDGPPKRFRDVKDGLSNTIALILAPPDQAVPWMSPEPWVISQENPKEDVFGHQEEVLVLALDGAVHTLKRDDMDDTKLKALLTIDGKERIDW